MGMEANRNFVRKVLNLERKERGSDRSSLFSLVVPIERLECSSTVARQDRGYTHRVGDVLRISCKEVGRDL